MTRRNQELDYEQLITLWNIAGRPSGDDELTPMLSTASREARVRFLTMLASDEDKWVRCSVASNSETPIEVLIQLAQDDYDWVRKDVADNPNTPIEVLAYLADDEASPVREEVADNRNTPMEALMTLLLQDEDEVVLELAEWNLGERCSDPSTPREVFEQLAMSTEWDVRSTIAESDNTPVDILQALVDDEHQEVRRKAHANLEERS